MLTCPSRTNAHRSHVSRSSMYAVERDASTFASSEEAKVGESGDEARGFRIRAIPHASWQCSMSFASSVTSWRQLTTTSFIMQSCSAARRRASINPRIFCLDSTHCLVYVSCLKCMFGSFSTRVEHSSSVCFKAAMTREAL